MPWTSRRHRVAWTLHVVRHWLIRRLRWLEPSICYFGCPIGDADLQADPEARRDLGLDHNLEPNHEAHEVTARLQLFRQWS
jgi:hypothetical protein